MKKLLIIAVLALCLTALVGMGTVASGSGGNITGTPSVEGLIRYEMAPGDSVEDYGDLFSFFWLAGFDALYITNTSERAGTLQVEIEDCCLMGDTMVGMLLTPSASVDMVDMDWATSPATFTLGPASIPGGSWALVFTGYMWCPGGFPAGYYISISM